MRAAWISALLLAGCMDDLPAEEPTGAARFAACTALENATFASVQQDECGLGPSGPVPCNWHLTITPVDATRSAFQYAHSDVGESGYLRCDETGAITTDEPALYDGHFDDATLDLIWDGRAYQFAQ